MFDAARLLVLAAALASAPVRAEDLAEFYRGKTISIVVGYAPGGGYDHAARVVAKHMGARLPGEPRMVVRNMPGAGSILAANYLQSGAPRDGTTIASANDANLIAPLIKLQGAQFDPREFGWLGSMAARGTPIVYVRGDAPATTLAAARETELLLGATGPDTTASYPAMMNELLGTKFRTVLGYKGGSAEINLAIERGEVHGRASWEWQSLKQYQPEWLATKFVTVIAQLGLRPNPELPGVPSVFDLAASEEHRQIMELVLGTGQFLRAFFAPPGVPPERLAALREAFEKTVRDPAFVKDMAAVSPLDVEFVAPREIEAFLDRVYKFPPSVVGQAAKFVGQ